MSHRSDHIPNLAPDDEIDPLLPLNDANTVLKSPHSHSPKTRRARRPSFGATLLAGSPSRDRGLYKKGSVGSAAALAAPYVAAEDALEIDALGMLHNDLSGTSVGSDSLAGGSFIDHTKFARPSATTRHHPKDGATPIVGAPGTVKASTRSSNRKSSTSSTSPTSRYLPPLSKAVPQPSQTTRPSFAEQWIKRHSSSTSEGRSGPQVVANPFAFDDSPRGYGAIPLAPDTSKRRSSRYIPDQPFQDDYLDTAVHPESESDEFEFSGSNPSSRRSSDSASLDDVCFPLVDIVDEDSNKMWPDVLVLEEFAKEERKELELMSRQNAQDFKPTEATCDSSLSSSHEVNFQNPLVTSIDANAPISKLKVNETEPINGRLRPPKIVPWDPRSRLQLSAPMFITSGNAVPQMANFDYSRSLIEQFRFTYFREDLDSTVHSPTISGLLHEGQNFGDLFLASQYRHSSSLSGSASMSRLNNNSNSNPVSRTPTATKTPTPSIKAGVEEPAAPFWLDVLNPTEEEMKVLLKLFGIHPLTTEDIFLGETREKVELFRDYYLVCFRSFDIVHERYKQKKLWEKAQELEADNGPDSGHHHGGSESWFRRMLGSIWLKTAHTLAGDGLSHSSSSSVHSHRNSSASAMQSDSSSLKLKLRRQKLRENKQKGGYRHKPREGELAPLNMYIIVFRDGVITFHFAPTPHPVNVRRRARLLRDYLTVSADWIGYALIDDITDAFAPMIESIEDEVNAIEDAILTMNSYDSTDEDSSECSSDESDSDSDHDDSVDKPFWNKPHRSKPRKDLSDNKSSYSKGSNRSRGSKRSVSTKSSSSSSTSSSSSYSSRSRKVAGWKKKGDMLRRIGECRKRVMSILRLLGSKADVIKGFAKRCNEQWEVAPRSDIGMYLGDIQDHIVTMVQSLNHYEKLLARSHSNYLAQINIDMTRVNNDMNDVLGKITILGTVVLPMNIITGLWGMNVIVPGQDVDSLTWFFGILFGMCLLAFLCYVYARRAAGLMA